MRCLIFGSAKMDSYDLLTEYDIENSYIICADGGYRHAEKMGVVPDLWLGDGDSGCVDVVRAKEIKTFPARKDFTDTDLAVEEALKRGAEEIIIAGGIGGRLDHEFSHFCLLKKILDRGAKGYLVNKKNEITMENKSFILHKNGKNYVSFFPYGGAVTGFSISGLRYSAKNLTLDCGMVQASSNCFDDETEAHVSFDSGYVLVMRACD